MKGSVWASIGALVLASCGGLPRPEESETLGEPEAELVVYPVNYPLAYFAERIGGDRVVVELPVPTGVDPASWSPDPEIVAAYQKADLILLNGADYAKWVSRVSLPSAKLVDTGDALESELLVDDSAVTHSHGPEGEHSHAETLSTTWLDLELAARQAEAVLEAFVAARPESESFFRERYVTLAADLAELDAAFTSLPKGLALLAASPAFGYLARRYELDVRSFRFDPADMLGSDFWHDVEHALEDRGARWMLWERAPSGEARAKLQEMGVESVVLDPAGARPTEGDFLSVMRRNRERLENVLSEG